MASSTARRPLSRRASRLRTLLGLTLVTAMATSGFTRQALGNPEPLLDAGARERIGARIARGGQDAYALSRLLELHLDLATPPERERRVRAGRRAEEEALRALADGPTGDWIGSWLVCATPAGLPPEGPPVRGTPCVSGPRARLWTRVQADPGTGLVWLGDYIADSAPERDERIHLIPLLPPTHEAQTQLSLAVDAARLSLMRFDADRGGPSLAMHGGPFTGAPRDQLIVPLRAFQPDRSWLYLELRPSPETTPRIRARLLGPRPIPSDLEAPGPVPDVEGFRASVGALETVAASDFPPHPLAPRLAPTHLRLAFARALGLPDGPARLEDVLLARSFDANALDDLLLALPLVRRPDARMAVASFHAAETDAAPLELAQASLALDLGIPQRALVHLGRHADEGSDLRRHVETRLALALDDHARVLTETSGIPAETSVASLVMRARALTTLGMTDEARRWLTAGRRMHPGNLALLALSVETATAPGDRRRLLEELAEAQPSRLRWRLALARTLAASGQTAEARALALALSTATGGPAVSTQTRLELVELLHTLDLTAEAIEIVGAALHEAPADPFARQLEATLIRASRPASGGARHDPRRLGPFADHVGGEIAEDILDGLPDLETLAALPVEAAPGDWEILDERSHLLLGADGSAHRLSRRVLRAGPGGAGRTPHSRAWRWPFDPSRAAITMLSAVRYTPTPEVPGGWTRRPLRGIHSEAEREGAPALYAETRALVIPVGSVPEGTVIELLWRVSPTGHFFPGNFELLEPLHLEIPRHRYTLTALWPPSLAPGVAISSGSVPGGEVAIDTRTAGRLTLDLTLTPATPREPFAPPRAELAPVLQLSTFGDWGELARWYADLIRPQIAMLPPMREAVAALSARHRTKAGLVDQAGLSRRIAELVAARVRYVGLEFGIHGYKPYRTDDVWARRFGDCKDQALLLVALLAEAGIAADPVLVRTRRLGRVGKDDGGPLPMLAAFDHAIVRLRNTGHFVDPTALHFGYDVLHPDNQGAQGLIVPMSPGLESAFVTLPLSPAARNGTRGELAFHVNADGSAHVVGQVRFIGTSAGNWRARLAAEAQQRERVEAMLSGYFDGFELTRHAVEGLDPDAAALRLRFEGDLRALATLEEGARSLLRIRAPLPLGGQRQRLGAVKGRQLPLVLGPPSSGRFEVSFTLPPGHTLHELPRAYQASTRGVSAETAWRQDPPSPGAPVRVTGTVELSFHEDTLAPTLLRGLAEVLEGLDAALAQSLDVEVP